MKNKHIFVVLTIVLFVLFLNVNFAFEFNSTDSNCNDLIEQSYDEYKDVESENNDIINISGSFTNLYFAIDELNDGGTINLVNNIILFDGERFSDGITINKNITIEGNGFTIIATSPSGKVDATVFNIKSDCNLTLKNLNILKANTAIIDNGGVLNSYNLNFISCKGIGSCVKQIGGFLYMNQSIFSDCSAPAIYLLNKSVAVLDNMAFAKNYRSIYNDDGCNLTVINSYFIENTGGATISNFGNLTVINSTFNSNDGTQVPMEPGEHHYNYVYGGVPSGSAIYNNNGNVNIIDSSFRSNHAFGGGAAIASNDGNVNIVRSNFTKNVVYQDHVNNIGSAIVSYGSNFNIINSSFSENRRSAALYVDGGGDINVIGSLFYHNDGDGIFAGWAKGNLNIKDTDFIKNTVMAISTYGYSYNIQDSYFEGNNMYNDNSYYNSAAIQDYSGQSNLISGTTFIDNGRAILSSSNLTVLDSDFIRNSHVDGGAIYYQGKSLNIANSNFTDNSAKNDGDAIYDRSNKTYKNGYFNLDGIFEAVSSIIEEIINNTQNIDDVNNNSAVDNNSSAVDGNASVVDGNSSVVDGNSSVVDGNASVVDGNSTNVPEDVVPDDFGGNDSIEEITKENEKTNSSNVENSVDDNLGNSTHSTDSDFGVDNYQESSLTSAVGESSSTPSGVESSSSPSASESSSSPSVGESSSTPSVGESSSSSKAYEISKDVKKSVQNEFLPFIFIAFLVLLLFIGYRKKRDFD